MIQITFASQAALKNATIKLKKIVIPFAQGPDCIQINEGLASLVFEVLGSNPLQVGPLGEVQTQVDVYAGPISAQLSKQKRLLVHLPREQKLHALAELLQEATDKRVCIIVANDNQSKELKHQLAGKGIDSRYVIDHNSDRLNTNKILIGARNRVSSPLFALDKADLVVFYDAVMLLNAKSIPAEHFYSGRAYETADYTPSKIDLSMLFQADSPTVIPSNARVLGLLTDELPLLKLRELWNLLSIESLSLDASRRLITTHKFRFVNFIHHELPAFNTVEPSSFQIRKQAIWLNPARNLFIGQVIKKLQGWKVKGELTNVQTALDWIPVIEGLANIIIVAENKLQLSKFHDFYNCETVSGDASTTFATLSTLSTIRLDNKNPCIIVRIDGGVGELPSFNLGGEVFVIDVADKNKNLPYFANGMDHRKQAYCDLGWTESGRPILESKWIGNQSKEQNRKNTFKRTK